MTDHLDRHVAVVDLGYGDAGKGTVVDWLCATRPVHAVVRFNGGAQAGHNVVTRDGRTHTFAQFGSGTLRGVPTLLSRFVVVDPLALSAEAEHLSILGVPDPYGLLTVDRRALVATPYHRLANQAREIARGAGRHGSCGMGVGEAVAYALDHPREALRFGDLVRPAVLRRKLGELRSWLAATLADIGADPTPGPGVDECMAVFRDVEALVTTVDGSTVDLMLAAGPCVFEGAQGVLLDEWRGLHPYTTWSTTTFGNVAEMAGGDAVRLGVLRCFTTRHGAGPLVTEDAGLTARLADPHNPTGPWQGAFRVGHFDAVAHRYAIEVAGGVDALALTHVDVADRTPDLRICRAYRIGDTVVDRLEPGPFRDLAYQAALTARVSGAVPMLDRDAPTDWVAEISAVLDVAVELTSHGPTAGDKRVPVGAARTTTTLARSSGQPPSARHRRAWAEVESHLVA
jgi:adenylosuccinate synthase